MSKILIFFLILLTSLTIYPNETLASENCSTTSSGNISYSPQVFHAPKSGETLSLNFTINNDSAYNRLRGREVRLHFIVPGVIFFGDYNTPEITIPIDSKTFSIPLTGDAKMISPGKHETILDLKIGDNRHEEFCKGITYNVGDPNICRIDDKLPKEIPPNSEISIKFAGKENTEYKLYVRGYTAIGVGSAGVKTRTTTDNSGQGIFSNILIEGNTGDKKNIVIGFSDGDTGSNLRKMCQTDIQISVSAPEPIPPSSEPVPTPPPGITIGPEGNPVDPKGADVCIPPNPKCTSASGTQCGSDKDPAIATAIGCIRTSPVGFVRDLFKFFIGIAGGLAFLMMLAGAYQMLTSAGNPETLSAGRDRFQSAIIGLLFIIFSILLLRIIGVDILGLGTFFGVPGS